MADQRRVFLLGLSYVFYMIDYNDDLIRFAPLVREKLRLWRYKYFASLRLLFLSIHSKYITLSKFTKIIISMLLLEASRFKLLFTFASNLFMESSSPSKAFSDFLSFFPKATLPLTIQHDDHHHFSKSNDALPDELLQEYVIPNLDFEIDEFTEFLPCLQFESAPGMHHVVLWTARLMHYSFYVMNFSAQGLFLDMAEVAGFYSDNDKLIQMMAHVDVEGNLFLVEGNLNDIQNEVSPDKTKKWQLEILPDGLFQTTAIKL